MTESDQAARLAAIRARRGQAPVDPLLVSKPAPADHAAWAPPAPTQSERAAVQRATPTVAVRPTVTRTKRPHVAAGARIVMTGVAASSVFGLTTVIAAANRPVVTTATTPAADAVAALPAAPATTLAPVTTVPATVAVTPGTQVVTLTVPALIVAPAPAPATPAASAGSSGSGSGSGSGSAKPAAGTPAAAPVVTAAPAPVVTAAPAPPPTQPAPPATSKPSG